MSSATRRQIAGSNGLISRRMPFKGSNIHAVSGPYGGTGQMPAEVADLYRSHRDRIAYTVVSYATPIAWVLTDETVVQPAVKYSVTTSNHQSLAAWLRS